MKTLLFSAQGRIGRGQYWKGILVSLVANLVVVGVASAILASMIPNAATEDGQFNVSGAAAVPFILLYGASMVFGFWSSICLGIKRLHDHGKSGVLVLLAFVPLANIWYLIVTAFLKGDAGPNAYGPDPLAMPAPGAPLSYAPAR